MARLRLSLFLARAGIASRRAAEQLIDRGRVSVNGEPVRTQGVKVDPALDRIEVNGRRLEAAPQAKRYFLFHKPLGVVTTLKDKHAEKCVADYFRDIPEKLVPAGRLDKNSTGLLLLTNDGEIIHRLYSCETMMLGGKRCLLSISIDITQRKHAEEFRRGKVNILSDTLVALINHQKRSPAGIQYFFNFRKILFQHFTNRPAIGFIGCLIA